LLRYVEILRAQDDKREHVVIVASEKLSPVAEDWLEVPRNHVLQVAHWVLLAFFLLLWWVSLLRGDVGTSKHDRFTHSVGGRGHAVDIA
jgi:hypothetical protein